ncbi:MAG: hypothetical protein DWG76_01450 [Chloroflexi bacterium]|nr:hypothetical protein [Chloroflexota bacterium]
MLGGMLATLFGAAFHVWRGGNGFRLLLYQGLAWLGFWGGHWVAGLLGWEFASYGPLHIGLAILGSWTALGIGYWLSLMQNPL